MAVPDARASASDATLIAQTRRGDDLAFEALARRHHGALLDLAGLLSDEPALLVDAVLGDAYRTVRRRQGPHTWMRGYLLEQLRLRHAPGPVRDDVRRQVASEVAALADAWQAAVWHRSAEHETAGQVATVIGVSQERVDAVVRSAQEELVRSLLERRWHDEELPAPCRAHTRRLMTSRSEVAPRAVTRHAARCTGCAALLGDLDAVRRDLPDVMARQLLGDVGPDYLAVRRAGRGVRSSA